MLQARDSDGVMLSVDDGRFECGTGRPYAMTAARFLVTVPRRSPSLIQSDTRISAVGHRPHVEHPSLRVKFRVGAFTPSALNRETLYLP